MVMCYHQRDGSTILDLPIHYNSMASMVCMAVDYGSVVYTDDYSAYLPMRQHGFRHESVCHSSREYARDVFIVTTANK